MITFYFHFLEDSHFYFKKFLKLALVLKYSHHIISYNTDYVLQQNAHRENKTHANTEHDKMHFLWYAVQV